jgi:hypothetical protein
VGLKETEATVPPGGRRRCLSRTAGRKEEVSIPQVSVPGRRRGAARGGGD